MPPGGLTSRQLPRWVLKVNWGQVGTDYIMHKTYKLINTRVDIAAHPHNDVTWHPLEPLQGCSQNSQERSRGSYRCLNLNLTLTRDQEEWSLLSLFIYFFCLLSVSLPTQGCHSGTILEHTAGRKVFSLCIPTGTASLPGAEISTRPIHLPPLCQEWGGCICLWA